MINWDDVRKQLPVTETSTYLNAAAAGPLSRATAAAATEYYQQMMEDGDTHWDEWLEKREDVRRKVAAFINAEPDEIAISDIMFGVPFEDIDQRREVGFRPEIVMGQDRKIIRANSAEQPIDILRPAEPPFVYDDVDAAVVDMLPEESLG